jgi:hypothetical protein
MIFNKPDLNIIFFQINYNLNKNKLKKFNITDLYEFNLNDLNHDDSNYFYHLDILYIHGIIKNNDDCTSEKSNLMIIKDSVKLNNKFNIFVNNNTGITMTIFTKYFLKKIINSENIINNNIICKCNKCDNYKKIIKIWIKQLKCMK